MAINKSDTFGIEEQQIATWAKALAHPARVAIMKLLIQKQACICGDIVAELPLSQSTVSQHLKELKEAGLIKGTIDGPKVCYCVNETSLHEFANALLGFSNEYKIKSKCC
jgi:DNA-binding transcriptional ArsR family regulator